MNNVFEYSQSVKVSIGINASKEVGVKVANLGFHKVLIASGKHVSKTKFFNDIKCHLEREGVETYVYTDILNDPTVEQVDKGAEFLRASGAEAVVAIGGGSVIDTAKGMCMLQTNEGSIEDYLFGGIRDVLYETMPLIAVPTTAGTGSEVTHFAVINNERKHVKLSVAHPYLTPAYAIVDPLLTIGAPKFITATTGMDALTHAIESYVSLNASPISKAFSLEALRLIGENLRRVNEDGSDIEARYNMSCASTIAGMAFEMAGLGAVHGIAQAIGGVVHVSHGMANSLMLPYVMEKNLKGNYKAFADIAEALGKNTYGMEAGAAAALSVTAVFELEDALNIPMKLSHPDIGVTDKMFSQIIKETLDYRQLAINPVKLKYDDIEEILKNAY